MSDQKPSDADREVALEKLRQLHALEDAEAAELRARNGARITCHRGCSGCCLDDLSVWSVEAARIREEASAVLLERPHAPGGCAFLDAEGGCRIYEQRPYVCRTQGLPLRWFEVEGEVRREYRDICTLNEEGGPALEALDPLACWTLGPHEEALARLEQLWSGGRPRRVRLRDLFSEGGSAEPPSERVLPPR